MSLPTKHMEEVTWENIFKKYFISNALQKHRERTHSQSSYHMCVGGHYLRVGKEASGKKKKARYK